MAYTANDAISKAFRLFDEETDSKYEQNGNRTTAIELVNDGYFDICLETKCSRTNGTITTVPNNREVNQPSDCVGVFSIAHPNSYDFLKAISSQKILVNQKGLPSGYTLKTNKIVFDVIPDAAYSFDIDYANGPTEELELTEEPELIPEVWRPRVLPYYVLWKLFAIDKREEVLARAPYWQGEYEKKRDKMKAYFAGGQYAGRKPELG
jgi:hypothetical protein